MKRLALIAAVVLTTFTLESCRQADDFITNEEAATLKKAQDSSSELKNGNYTNANASEQTTPTFEADGEIVIPPKK